MKLVMAPATPPVAKPAPARTIAPKFFERILISAEAAGAGEGEKCGTRTVGTITGDSGDEEGGWSFSGILGNIL
ncbi:MAG TPA: hypothetical protein VHE82_13690 [Gemmatimonadaceae bacterium]|nr:hypothetical protein [Gemmatimonadaceae bacterium]